VGGAGVRVGVGRGVGVGVGEAVGVGLGVGVNDGSGRGVKVSPGAVGEGLGDAGAPAPLGKNDRAAPARMTPRTSTTSKVASTFPHMNEVWRRSGVVPSARPGGTIGSVGSLPRVVMRPMIARRHFVGPWKVTRSSPRRPAASLPPPP
jgi:hypothetical protein